MILTSIIDMWS